jgi:hypothetical protein
MPDLQAKLLSLGGDRIDPRPHPFQDALLERGEIFPVERRKIVRGYPSRCHQNAALYYTKWYVSEQAGDCAIVTGYALGDGFWRMHAWIWDGRRIIDTNDFHEVYFGVLLSEEEAVEFMFSALISLLPGFPGFRRRVEDWSAGKEPKAAKKRARAKRSVSIGSNAS